MIGLISLEMKQAGERSAGNPLAAFEVAGAGNVAWPRYCDTRRRKGEPTGNTNIGLTWRASLRPYLPDAPAELKFVIQFAENDKPMVLNATNMKRLLCVQRRLARSVGDSPTGVRVGAP